MKRLSPAVIDKCLAALADLCAADNVNYQRDTMRYAGLFAAARTALLEAGIDRTPGHTDWDWQQVAVARQAELRRAAAVLLETIDDMTTGQFACGEERPAREALRAALAAYKDVQP